MRFQGSSSSSGKESSERLMGLGPGRLEPRRRPPPIPPLPEVTV